MRIYGEGQGCFPRDVSEEDVPGSPGRFSLNPRPSFPSFTGRGVPSPARLLERGRHVASVHRLRAPPGTRVPIKFAPSNRRTLAKRFVDFTVSEIEARAPQGCSSVQGRPAL